MEKQGLGGNVVITNAVGTTNTNIVTFTAVNNNGDTILEPTVFDIWLADASTGLGLTVSVSGVSELAAVSGYGDVLGVIRTKKAATVITNASGVFKLTYVDTAKATVYPSASVPNNNGRVSVGEALVTASYG